MTSPSRGLPNAAGPAEPADQIVVVAAGADAPAVRRARGQLAAGAAAEAGAASAAGGEMDVEPLDGRVYDGVRHEGVSPLWCWPARCVRPPGGSLHAEIIAYLL